MIFYLVKRDGSRLQVQLSDQDADLKHLTWHMSGGRGGTGKYASRQSDGVTVYMHRMVAARMGLIESAAGGGRAVPSVDHINGNKLDNRRENLRLRNRSQQMHNLNDGLRANNTSGYRGVSRLSRANQQKRPWMAYVQVNYRTKSLGTFATMEEAVAARKAWDDTHSV